MLLGDAGATVIKIERPGTGDDTREWGPPFVGAAADVGSDGSSNPQHQRRLSTYFLSVNRGKKSVAVDIKHEAGLSIGRRLATEWADVVVENYKRGAMEQFGLGYDELAKANPRLVYCSISGFGATGPYSSMPGYDVVISGMYGLMSITGEENGRPAKVGVASTDVLTGTLAQSGILSALYARDRTGVGQKVDVSLMESQLAGLVNIASSSLNAAATVATSDGDNDVSTSVLPPPPPPPKRWGTAHESIVPYQAFRCKGNSGESIGGFHDQQDDQYIVIGAGNDRQFAKLVEVLEVPELARDPRFVTNAARVAHRQILIPLLEERFSHKTREEWTELLGGRGFPFGPLRNVQEAFDCKQARHVGMVQEMSHPVVGTIRLPKTPITFSSSAAAQHGPTMESYNNGDDGTSVAGDESNCLPPPMLGQHTAEVLRDVLHMDSRTIQVLEADRVIACWRDQ